jgi:hypothetical protein
MRIRTWIFAAVVALVLAINLGLVSLRIAQTGEETVRARIALASTALKAQLELLDARQSPRAVAANPELIEATRAPVDPTQPLGKPDERALRAAAATLQPEPDLLIVANGQGAILSRRAKAAQQIDDVARLPLVKAALEGTPPPTFATFDGALYRVAAARIPGNAAAVVAGTLVDDRLASLLRSQVDADVTLLQGGKPVASSLPAEERARVARWAAAPAPGYGVLQVRLPLIGTALSGKLPRGTNRYAVRGALVPLDAGMQAAATVPASPYLGWLGRYQAFYLFALVLFVLFGFVWGLVAPKPRAAAAAPVKPPPAPRPTEPSLDVGGPRAPPPAPAPKDLPWKEPTGPHVLPATKASEFAAIPEPPAVEPLDPVLPATAAAMAEPTVSLDHVEKPLAAHGPRSIWSGDPLTAPTGPFAMAEPALEPAPASPKAAELHEPPELRELPDLREVVEHREAPELPELREEPLEEAAVFGHPAAANGVPDSAHASSAAKGDFSFAGLLDDAKGATAAAPDAHPPLGQEDAADATRPGRPSEELLAAAREDETLLAYGGLAANTTHNYFPGDEPTRIEPVSAALLDKLREKDEPEQGPAAVNGDGDPFGAGAEAASVEPHPAHGAGEHAVGSPSSSEPSSWAAAPASWAAEPAARAHSEEQPEPPAAVAPPVTLAEFSMPSVEEQDPDETHWHETYEKFRELKAQLGEPADRITFEKFAARLRKNREDLLAKHHCKGVRFVVLEKDGRAAIKASAIR